MGTLSLLAAVMSPGAPGAAGTAPGVRPRCPAAPHSATAIWWHRQRDQGTVTGRDWCLQGAWKHSCSCRASGLMCLRGQQERGDKHLPGRFVLPETTGTEGHSRCGCPRALTPSQEGTGAARPPGPSRGLCQSQPIVSRGRGALPDPCPGQDVPAHAPAPPERRNLRPAEIRAQFLGADLSCCRALPADFGSPQRLRQTSINLCQLLIRGQIPELYLWSRSVTPSSSSRTQGTRGPSPVPPSLLLTHSHVLSRLSKFRVWKWAGTSRFIPALNDAWQSTHCPGRSCQAL